MRMAVTGNNRSRGDVGVGSKGLLIVIPFHWSYICLTSMTGTFLAGTIYSFTPFTFMEWKMWNHNDLTNRSDLIHIIPMIVTMI